MFDFFRKNNSKQLLVDIHSHLVPAIDDGSKSLEQSVQLITEMKNFGYQKLYTTPHIHPNYPNTEELITEEATQLKQYLTEKNVVVELEVAAEYYTDETLESKINNDLELLVFGEKYILVEVSFYNRPFNFEQIIFNLKAKGYQPVLAHPERYKFLEGEIDWLENLKQMGVLFQATIGSFSGAYNSEAMKIANILAKKDMIDFLGSDLHNAHQLKYLQKGLQMKPVKRLISSDRLLNHQLI